MFKTIKNLFPGLLILMLTAASCQDEETFPVTPEITFTSLEKFAATSGLDSLVLTFAFTDGDGDLGSPATDVSTRDIFVKLFEKKNGNFVEAVLAAPLEYRLPFLEPRGNNKSLKGDVKISIDYNLLQPNDTIRYEVFIKDRAGHKSNTIVTTETITGQQ